MNEPIHVVALSGGKDSTAMALRLAEVEPRDYTYLITPTGDELPDMVAHWERLECMLGKPMTRITNGTLDYWINKHNALPNFQMRWCTRQLKITPAIAFMKALPPNSLLYVGLRADEEARKGIYSEDVDSRFPLREWDWGLSEVRGYLRERGVKIPVRTDCARCYAQRPSEWFALWQKHPDLFGEAVWQEELTKHTFRNPRHQGKWDVSLLAMRDLFVRGHVPRGVNPASVGQMSLFDEDEEDENSCRVCRL